MRRGVRCPPLENAPRDFSADHAEWINAIRLSGRVGQPRHTPYDGGRLILDDHFATGFANLLGAEDAVGAHSRHHDGESAWAVRLGDGAKQHIYGGPA